MYLSNALHRTYNNQTYRDGKLLFHIIMWTENPRYHFYANPRPSYNRETKETPLASAINITTPTELITKYKAFLENLLDAQLVKTFWNVDRGHKN
jgi:hypothetical protein